MRNGPWRWVASVLASAVLAGGAAWFAFGADAVSEQEVRDLRGELRIQLRLIEDKLGELCIEVAEFRGEFRQWKRQTEFLGEK